MKLVRAIARYLRALYVNSPRQNVQALAVQLGLREPTKPRPKSAKRGSPKPEIEARAPKPEPPSAKFLRSAEYRELMSRHVPYDGRPGLHEAQTLTESFRFRHIEQRGRLSVYRWRGIEANLEFILEKLEDPSQLVVDWGGAAAPLGLGSVLVDSEPVDYYDRPVPHKSLAELPEKADVLVSSYMLHYLPSLEEAVDQVKEALVDGGVLMLHVPSFSCDRWGSGICDHALWGEHQWTFGLRNTPNLPDGLENYVEIDAFLENAFDVHKAEYCGDNGIVVIGEARG